MTEQPIIIEGPERVRAATLLTLASALALEINLPGMKISSRGSALDAARIQGVIPKGKRTTRAAALKATVAAIKEVWPAYEPNKSVARAMSKEEV